MFSLTNYVNSHQRLISFSQFSPLQCILLHSWDKFNFLHHPHCLLHNMTLTEYFWNDEMNKLTNKCIHVHKYLPWLNTSTISIFSFPFITGILQVKAEYVSSQMVSIFQFFLQLMLTIWLNSNHSYLIKKMF